MNGVVKFVAVAAVALACVSAAQAVDIQTVSVGSPGNAADTRYETPGYGGVHYVYNIGRFEVTSGQYTELLDAVADDDTYGLYNTDMGGEYGGITRHGSDGSYTYSTITGRGNMPVSYVSVYDTLRFINWMHNSKPTGAQDASTTEDGAYDMSLGSGMVRKCGARVFLPSEDEWYKAAYYKGGGTDAGYWDYPTQSDTAPTAEPPPGTDFVNGSANYDWGVSNLTYVGSYTAKPSDSACGTYDQGGNVWEMNELAIDSARGGVRGGSSYGNHIGMRASYRCCDIPHTPTHELDYVGFRVAGTCSLTDTDGDGDIDLADFVVYQTCFCGPVE